MTAKPPVYPATAELLALVATQRPDLAGQTAALEEAIEAALDRRTPGQVSILVAQMIAQGDEPRDLYNAVSATPKGKRHRTDATDAELLERRYH